MGAAVPLAPLPREAGRGWSECSEGRLKGSIPLAQLFIWLAPHPARRSAPRHPLTANAERKGTDRVRRPGCNSVKIPFSSGADHAAVRGPRVARTEDPSMDDERARGAAGAMTDRAESGAQPQQLVLWSALRDDDGEKSRPPRDLADRAASKFLLIEPVGPRAAAPAREIKADHEIRPPGRDEFMDPQPTTPALALWVQCALLVGALAVGLSLGWIGGAVAWGLFPCAPPPGEQTHPAGMAPRGGGGAPEGGA